MTEYTWGHKRRFNSYPEYFKGKFGSRVQKLTLNAGFTCPNRDGTKGEGGCTFCNNDAFNPSYCMPQKSITKQLEQGIAFHARRYRQSDKFLAYFQAFTNTYNDIEKLQVLYSEALAFPGVIGLVIGTRPDCISTELLDYLQDLSKEYYLIIEYGVESCYNDTLSRINRGHTFEDSVRAIDETAKREIRQGIHMIIGLPGESEMDILEEMKIISELPVNNIKFHQLQIVRNTLMATQYLDHPEEFMIFNLDEYLELMVRILERLNPGFVVERIAGEANPKYLLSPSWGIRYDQVVKKFEEKLAEKDTWQGRRYEGNKR